MPMDWEAFQRRYRPLLIRAASVRLRSAADAEEVAQRVLVRLSSDGGKALAALDRRAPLDSWLAVLAFREARDFARGEARERARVLKSGPRPVEALSPLVDLVRGEDAAALRKALEALPSRDRMLLRMVYWEEFTYADAARVLGVAEGSISPMLQRAREALKSEMGRTAPSVGGLSSL